MSFFLVNSKNSVLVKGVPLFVTIIFLECHVLQFVQYHNSQEVASYLASYIAT